MNIHNSLYLKIIRKISDIFHTFSNWFPPIDNLIIVTAANSLYYKILLNLLNSLEKYETKRIIIWDLGLLEEEKKHIQKRFNYIKIKHFDFSKYPAFFNIDINAGEYAWKPIIIKKTFEQYNGFILWLDAGCIISHRLNSIRNLIKFYGFYCPYSQDSIQTWTHEKTLDFFKLPKNHYRKKMLSAGIVGMNTKIKKTEKIISEWSILAYKRDAIAPYGSNRNNHRQDQSLLSIIFYKYFKRNPILCRNFYDLKTHQKEF